MAFRRQRAGTAGAAVRPGARIAFGLAGLSVVWLGCGAGMSNETDAPATAVSPDAGSTSSMDGSTSIDDGGTSTWTCGAVAPTADLCTALPTGAVAGCAALPNGDPSQNGYLDITMPDGSHVYTCATSDGSGGYWFDAPDAFMSDPQSCCGAAPGCTVVPKSPAGTGLSGRFWRRRAG